MTGTYGRAQEWGSPKPGWDPSLPPRKVSRATLRRVLSYARPYRTSLALFLLATALDAAITVVNPLLLRDIIDNGILARDERLVITLALVVASVAVFDAGLGTVMRWYAGRIGQGLTYDLRTQVFRHVLRQPVAFFTRSQTGSLVSRLNTDVVGAQLAITTVLSSLVSNVLGLAVILVAIFYLSWQVGAVAVALIPLFFVPAVAVGRRLERLTRQSMQLDAELGTAMTERFNVGGAMLVKLSGRLEEDTAAFRARGAKLRDLGVRIGMYSQTFVIALALLAALASASAYGVGGVLIIHRRLALGSLVALASLVVRLYGPINGLSNVPMNLLQALVSFDRVFEVLDLKPLIADRPGAAVLPRGGEDGTAPAIVFDRVCFRYPGARDVSVASLETIALPGPEYAGAQEYALRDVSFLAPPGRLTALVGRSGAGKTTITHLVARLYDPDSGAVRLGGTDVRDVTQQSLHEVVGVVTQDTYLFHDTIRANLGYGAPDAGEAAMVEALKAAQIWDLVSRLPDGLDTVVGDRGYRLSGGEKQRLALARLMLRAPSVVVLDEATAHLDSESESAVQAALARALRGRTSLVIAHRLSTVREADQILVVDAGRIVERGTHDDLLAAGGPYAELYRIQFADQEEATGPEPGAGADSVRA